MRDQSLAQGQRFKGLHRIRWAAGGEPLMQCAACYEYLPITAEFWNPVHGTRRCATCWAERQRERQRASQARIRAVPERLAEERDARRAKYAANREDRRSYHREYFRAHYSTLARAQAEGAA